MMIGTGCLDLVLGVEVVLLCDLCHSDVFVGLFCLLNDCILFPYLLVLMVGEVIHLFCCVGSPWGRHVRVNWVRMQEE